MDSSKITHETNYIEERKRLIEKLHLFDVAAHPDKYKPKIKENDRKKEEKDTNPRKSTRRSHYINTITSEMQKTSEGDKQTENQYTEREAEDLNVLEFDPKRKRDFKVKVTSRKNMFEGFSFFQYDQYVITEPTMQKIVLRDQLIIMSDKAGTLKNEIYDNAFTKKVKKHVSISEIRKVNKRVEEVMAIMNEVIKLLLFGSLM